MKRLLLASTAFLLPLAAQASVFVPGSLFSVEAVNSPGDTPAGGAVVSLVDFVNQVIVTSGGAVNLRVTETRTGRRAVSGSDLSIPSISGRSRETPPPTGR